MSANQRLLLVHAHPDDESIGTGATMAKYVAAGAQVTLVTCTLGDEGEILIPELAHLAAHDQDQLAGHRLAELAEAMAFLGVTDYRILGGIGTYRDSGMIGTEPNSRPDSFWQADLLDAAKHLVKVIREVKPQVVVTYDDFGGYGHPDHIQAHRVTTYAVALAGVASFAPELGLPWHISKLYWTAFPVSVMRAGIEALRAAGEDTGFAAQDPDDVPFACPDEFITTVIDATEHIEQKFSALRAHATQINAESGFFALSNNLGSQVMGYEYYRLAFGEIGPIDASGHETDLFSGIFDA
ncbi:MAG: N-acetyl-1-D-myo-inositol-2-amino-2-deoxy-alpha-D-glucopyranoside deacetylase [Actinobacteria bacterium]|nr:N-acetyl-1-D-myo-inositol-2-amino-2-deoxy-alpha-D-glucopyranoside deacetylase [Actinomycetota bacterium]NBY15283.1 N-acetyl-1-D-myo-inositol-2-amino-2-deoxy-alpha-D-glucopyranoside deacetylase [Actinomycetota bacterium]